MGKRLKCNLKQILDSKPDISIRKLAADINTSFENVRRLYHDETIRYDRKLMGSICERLNIGIDELLILVDDDSEAEQK